MTIHVDFFIAITTQRMNTEFVHDIQ